MKRIIICLLLVVASTVAMAQKNIVAGVRYETTEISVNDEQYSLFMYRDEGEEVGYYLSLGHVEQLLEVRRDDISTFSMSHVDEVCLCLGYSTEEAYASLDTLLAFCEYEVGTTIEMPARICTGVERLGAYTTTSCVVKKPLIGNKKLYFMFDNNYYVAETYLSRSSIKQLRRGLKFYKWMHPDKK